MAKSAKRKRDDAVTTAADRSAKSLPNRSALVTHSDVARRAYDLYLARGCHMDTMFDDWLQAERKLRARSTAA